MRAFATGHRGLERAFHISLLNQSEKKLPITAVCSGLVKWPMQNGSQKLWITCPWARYNWGLSLFTATPR